MTQWKQKQTKMMKLSTAHCLRANTLSKTWQQSIHNALKLTSINKSQITILHK